MKISHEFIPYEQALELKELGFDELCIAYYDQWVDTNNEVKQMFRVGEVKGVFDNITPAPLYQQAFRWFREKYNITSEISISANHRNDAKKWMHSVTNLEVMLYTNSDITFETYEEAELACLKKLIEIAKNK